MEILVDESRMLEDVFKAGVLNFVCRTPTTIYRLLILSQLAYLQNIL